MNKHRLLKHSVSWHFTEIPSTILNRFQRLKQTKDSNGMWEQGHHRVVTLHLSNK